MYHLIKLVISLAMLVSMQVYADPVDINTADISVLAGAIDGVEVKGIGAVTVDKNRHNLVVVAPEKK
jgi:uncharacterized protein YqfA (UPF0365 family)